MSASHVLVFEIAPLGAGYTFDTHVECVDHDPCGWAIAWPTLVHPVLREPITARVPIDATELDDGRVEIGYRARPRPCHGCAKRRKGTG